MTQEEIAAKIKGRTLYVVSDLHMGDGTEEDNFALYRGRFSDFVKQIVEPDTNGCLVMAGDVFEFWQSKLGDVIRANFDLVKQIVGLKPIYIVGNHDVDLQGLIGLQIDSPLVSCLTSEVVTNRGGKEIRICHGHEFDKFNNEAHMILGRIAAQVAGQVEMEVGPKIGSESTEAVLNQSVTGFLDFAKDLWSRHKTPAERKKDAEPIDDVREKLDEYHKLHPAQILVAGHTHEAGLYGGWYTNSGSWQDDKANYVCISPEGELTLRKWPGGDVDTTPLWPERSGG